MTEIAWDHRWFGIWKEMGNSYAACPSIRSFINPTINAQYDVKRLCNYLETAHVIATTSRRNFPCLITGERFDGSLSCRTDGVWVWWDDLSHYVKEHGLFLPREMSLNVEKNLYMPPPVDGRDIEKLDWPPL